MGRQPIEANSDRRAPTFSRPAMPSFCAGEAFEQLNSDMSPALEKYLKGLRARWKDLVRSDEKAKARQILIELVDQNIAEIDAILAEHDEESPDRRDERIQAQATRDSTREGEANRRYLAKCRIGLDRGLTTYRKLRKDRFERAKRGADEKEIYGRGGELLVPQIPRGCSVWDEGSTTLGAGDRCCGRLGVSGVRSGPMHRRPERGGGGGWTRRHDRRQRRYGPDLRGWCSGRRVGPHGRHE